MSAVVDICNTLVTPRARAGVWIETSYIACWLVFCNAAPPRVGGRGLKLACEISTHRLSLPVWGRGLKPCHRIQNLFLCMSLPHGGAWIEMSL